MPADIRIADLAKPGLTEAQRAALEYTNTLTIELTADSILSEAREVTGLDDFGPDDFMQRLNLLCDEWGGDDGLTNLGQLSLRNKLLQHARSRLLIQDVLTKAQGSTNPLNLVKAAINALQQLRTREDVERLRGVTLS